MKHTLAMSLACGILALFLTTTWAADTDADKLQGTWQGISAESGGQKLPDEVIKKVQMTLVITGDKYTVNTEGKLLEQGTFKVDAGKTPNTIDLTITEGKNKGMMQLGIYKIDGDTLTIALPATGNKTRPTEFVSKAGSDVEITVLKREKK